MKRTPVVHIFVLTAFLINTFGSVPTAQAQDFRLPAPGVMVHLSPPLDPPILKGIKVHPDNPFKFEFILDKGDNNLSNDQLKDESRTLVKYFLASLTIPENDLWVNLSPYEKDRIIPNSFGLTEMGRDLLAEDYMLKQITASLIYPEDEIGKKFWNRIYEEAAKRFGTTNIPVNTFNKVWIIPEKAVVYENAKIGAAYVVESKLKVMLEQDYLSLEKHEGIQSFPTVIPAKAGIQNKNDISSLGSKIVREIVIPELTREVNENKNFAKLRQVYNSLILATWYKKKIKDSILEQVYADKSKVAGVNIDDPKEKERIYQKYLRAFKKGVFNYIKEDIDPATQETIPRKYFSGGLEMDMTESHYGMDGAAFSEIKDQRQVPADDLSRNEVVVNADVAMTGSISALMKKINLVVSAVRRLPVVRKNSLNGKTLIYDSESKTLVIRDKAGHESPPIKAIGYGGNNDVFEYLGSIIRINFSGIDYYDKSLLKITRLLGKIGAGPRLLSEPRETQEGNLYIQVEKVEGRDVHKLITEENRALNPNEIAAVEKILDLLIDNKIAVIDFWTRNIMLGHLPSAPNIFGAFAIDFDNLRQRDIPFCIGMYIASLNLDWRQADPEGRLVRYLEEKLKTYEGEKDGAMVVRSVVLAAVAAGLFTTTALGQRLNQLPAGKSFVIQQGVSSVSSVDDFMKKTFSKSTFDFGKRNGGDGYGAVRENIAKIGVEESSIILTEMFRFFGQERVERALKNNQYYFAPLLFHLSTVAGKGTPTEMQGNIHRVFAILAEVLGKDVIQGQLEKDLDSFMGLIYDFGHSKPNDFVSRISRMDDFFTKDVIRKIAEHNPKSFRELRFKYRTLDSSRDFEKVFTQLTAIFGRDLLMHHVQNNAEELSSFMYDFGASKRAAFDEAVKMLRSRFGSRFNVLFRDNLKDVEMMIFGDFSGGYSHSLKSGTLQQTLKQFDELFDDDFRENFFKEVPPEMVWHMEQLGAVGLKDAVTKARRIFGENTFDDMVSDEPELFANFISNVVNVPGFLDVFEKESFLTAKNQPQVVRAAKAALSIPVNIKHLYEKKGAAAVTKETIRRMHLIMAVLKGEFPELTNEINRIAVRTLGTRVDFMVDENAFADFRMDTYFMYNLSYKNFILVLAHEIGHNLLPNIASEFGADVVAHLLGELMGWDMHENRAWLEYPYSPNRVKSVEKETHAIARNELSMMAAALQGNKIPMTYRGFFKILRIMDKKFQDSSDTIDAGVSDKLFKEVFIRWVLESLGINKREHKRLVAKYMKVPFEIKGKPGQKGIIFYKDLDNFARRIKEETRPLSIYTQIRTPHTATITQGWGTKGGIDLTPANMNLQTEVMDSRFRGNDSGSNGNGSIKFHLTPAMLRQLQNAPGFTVGSITIEPLKSLSGFLGLNQSTQTNQG